MNPLKSFLRKIDPQTYEFLWENERNEDIELCDFPKTKICLPRFTNPIEGKDVLISGRAPIWVYMASALAIFSKGARRISSFQPQCGNISFFPFPQAEENAVKPQPDVRRERNFCFVSYPPTHFSVDQISGFAASIPEPQGEKHIIISGKLCNWMAAVLAIAARQRGWKRIGYFSPRNRQALQVFPKLKWLKFGTPLARNGKVIGVVGDPNSGKSVFSNLLENSGRDANESIWFFDCDYSSPTPPWYLMLLKNTPKSIADTLRRKREWIPGAEAKISRNVDSIKRALDWLIADLPGGNFKKNPPERIPPGREVLMDAIDYFVVLAKKSDGGDSGVEWRRALREHRLEERIVLTIYSEAPLSLPNLRQTPDGAWHICGLDRSQSGNFPEKIKQQLWSLIKTSIK